MSGKPWSAERKAAHAKRMKARWSNPAYRSAQVGRLRALNNGATARAAASERMRQLNERMRSDDALKRKCVSGMTKSRRDPAYRKMQSLVMAETMSRPENKAKAREHCASINRDPKVRDRQWAGRRRNTKIAEKPARGPGREAAPQAMGPDALFLELLANEVRNHGH
nr:hypothetical protein [uncultured Bradyrhizobium sp.]